MKFTKRFGTILCLCALIFSGCAAAAKYEKALDSWIGASETDLVKRMGPPDSVYQPDTATRMLIYYESSISYASAMMPDYLITNYGSSVYMNTYGHGIRNVPVEMNELKCKTSFTVKEGKVTDWRWEGNHCA